MLVKATTFLLFPTPISWNWRPRVPIQGRKWVVVKAGYKRTPMDAAGAYELVDEETGEKVIVWGGSEDGDDVIPPKHLLHPSNWKPTRPPQSEKPGGGAVSFQKLKVNKIQTLVKKSSRMKQEAGKLGNYNEEQVVVANGERRVSRAPLLNKTRDASQANRAGAFVKNRELSVESGNRTNAEPRVTFSDTNESDFRSNGERRVSRAPLLSKTRDTSQANRAGAYVKNREPSVESGFRRTMIPEPEITSSDNHESDIRRNESEKSVSKGSTDHLKGWGDRGENRNSRYNEMDVLKRQRKVSADSGFFSRKSFRDVGCSEYMIESLKVQQFTRPSRIQALAFEPVSEGKTCIIADQSGSGKTLAYLVPVIQRLREEELQGLSKASSGSPRVIIMVPTAELASQVLNNCRAISKCGVPFRSMVATGGFRQKTQMENLEQGVDVLIATPGRFMYLVKGGFLQLTNLRCAVLDEVDILFNDEEFEVAFKSLINTSPFTAQYLFVTATLPVEIYNKLVEIFPDCEVTMGPGMHRTSTRLEEFLIDCSGEGDERTPETAFANKKSALLRLAEESPVHKTIIFCNKIETCRKVENALTRFDRRGARARVLPFHAALDQETRVSNMKLFTNSQPGEESLFLVCTDRASRGIDFVGVDHVVLFDFPRDPSEYVRRVGRTARGAGGRGKAFVFAVGKQVSLASRIMERNRKGHPLHDVPSAYELMG